MASENWEWSKCFGHEYHNRKDFNWTTARESERKSDNLEVTRARIYRPVMACDGGGFMLDGGATRRGMEDTKLGKGWEQTGSAVNSGGGPSAKVLPLDQPLERIKLIIKDPFQYPGPWILDTSDNSDTEGKCGVKEGVELTGSEGCEGRICRTQFMNRMMTMML